MTSTRQQNNGIQNKALLNKNKTKEIKKKPKFSTDQEEEGE